MDVDVPGGGLSLDSVVSGMVVRGRTPVDVVTSANRVVPIIGLVVPVPKKVESVLSDEEVESEGGVTGSKKDTSGIVGLLVSVLGLEVLHVVLGEVVSGSVGASLARLSAVSRAGMDGAVSTVGLVVAIKPGNSSVPIVRTVLLTAVVVPVVVPTTVGKLSALLVLVK